MNPIEGEPWLKCPTCGYDLRGLPENQCPECGEYFDPSRLRGQHQKRFGATIAIQSIVLAIVLPVVLFFLNLISYMIVIMCIPTTLPYGEIIAKSIMFGVFSGWVVGPIIVLGFFRYRLQKNGIPLLNWATITLVLLLTGEILFVMIFVYKITE